MEPKEIAEIAKYGSIFTAGALAGAYSGRIKGAASDVARALHARNLKSNIGNGIWLVYNEICCRVYDLINSLDLWKNRKPAEGLEQRISEMDIFSAKLPQKLGQEGLFAVARLENMGLEKLGQWYGGYNAAAGEKALGIRKEFNNQVHEILVTKNQMNLYERMLAGISGARHPRQKTSIHVVAKTENTPAYAGIYVMIDEVVVKGDSVEVYPENMALLLDSLNIPDREMRRDIETASKVMKETEKNEILRKKVLGSLTHANHEGGQGENSAEKILEAR